MENEALMMRLLPASLVIKGFVSGAADCSYERYMMEFVNASGFFRSKSAGELYNAPESEAHGECDCISQRYQMDFKLIAGKTAMQARSLLSNRETIDSQGVRVTGAPRAEGPLQAVRIHAALRNRTLDMLRALRENPPKGRGVGNDLYELLKTLETRKNLLLFFPYELYFRKECDFSDGLARIQEILSDDFQCAMQYRRQAAAEFDTYMAFIYRRNLVFMQGINQRFCCVDCVGLKESSVYQRLAGFGKDVWEGLKPGSAD